MIPALLTRYVYAGMFPGVVEDGVLPDDAVRDLGPGISPQVLLQPARMALQEAR